MLVLNASLISQNILNIDMDNYDNITDSLSHSQDIHASPNVSTSESQDSLLPGSSSYTVLNDPRVKKVNRITFAHININSIRNKFEMIAALVKGRIDVFFSFFFFMHFCPGTITTHAVN